VPTSWPSSAPSASTASTWSGTRWEAPWATCSHNAHPSSYDASSWRTYPRRYRSIRPGRPPPAARPDGDLPFDWAMIRATDEQRNAPDPVWWDHMGRITMPTLLIGGGATSLIPQDQVAVLAELIPDTELVTIDAGHLVHGTRPQEFLAVLEEFLTA